MNLVTSYSPVTTAFAAMSVEHLCQFYEDFIQNIPYCVEELHHFVRSTSGYEGWTGDYSPSSIEMLGAWFAKHIEKRDLSDDERNKLASQTRGNIELPSWELTSKTKTLIVYVGVYFGQVMIEQHPGLRWEQQLGSRDLADFGQPVVKGSVAPPLNPVRITSSLASGIIKGTKDGTRLRDTYSYWSNLIQSTLNLPI